MVREPRELSGEQFSQLAKATLIMTVTSVNMLLRSKPVDEVMTAAGCLVGETAVGSASGPGLVDYIYKSKAFTAAATRRSVWL